MKTGIFIVFEGGDNCGKSTLSKWLVKELQKRGLPTVWTREPGGTRCPVAEKIRAIIIDPKNDICDRTEALLFAASRAQHIIKLIRPQLMEGVHVVSDRFVSSSYVYQGIARKIGISRVKTINNFAREGLQPYIEPDITFLLDLDVKKGIKRTLKKKKDRIEQEDITFHKKIREGFLRLAKKDSVITVIDAELSEKEVCRKVLKQTLKIIKTKGRK